MDNIHPIFKDALSPFMQHLVQPLRDQVAEAKAQQAKDRVRALANFLRCLSDNLIPADHPELVKLAQDCIEELGDINERWREEVRWRL